MLVSCLSSVAMPPLPLLLLVSLMFDGDWTVWFLF
jgi:hypothetical protein